MLRKQFSMVLSLSAQSLRYAKGAYNEGIEGMSSHAPKSAEDLLGGLRGQRVVITAGAAGIGLAIADTLAKLGARLVICDISDEALGSVGDKVRIEAGVKADVSSEADVERLFETAQSLL